MDIDIGTRGAAQLGPACQLAAPAPKPRPSALLPAGSVHLHLSNLLMLLSFMGMLAAVWFMVKQQKVAKQRPSTFQASARGWLHTTRTHTPSRAWQLV